MEHQVSTWHVILNVAIQVLNIVLFFFLFIKFVGKPITKMLVERIEQEKKLAAAEEAYNARIADAEKQAEAMVAEAQAHKNNIIAQGEGAAKQRAQELLDEAQRKAADIADNAEKQANLLRTQMEEKFTQAVSSTTHLIVNKLFEKDDVHTSYIDGLVKEFVANKQNTF